MPCKLSRARCPGLIGSKAHMAAYKRPTTVEVRIRGPQNHATSQTTQRFSLSIQLDQTLTNSENWRNFFTNPNRFRSKIEPKSMEFLCSSQRFDWIFIIEPWFLQFKRQIHCQKQRIRHDHRIIEIEKKKVKNLKILNRLRRRRRNHQFISGFQRESVQNRIKPRISEESNQTSE